jgi:hypothetical protein
MPPDLTSFFVISNFSKMLKCLESGRWLVLRGKLDFDFKDKHEPFEEKRK